MTLGIDRLRRLLDADPPLVAHLSDRELTDPEGAGFDLRVGRLYVPRPGHGFLGVTERQTPAYDEAEPAPEVPWWWLRWGGYWLIETLEEVNLPANLAATVTPRTTLFRCGLALLTAPVHPGYRGTLTFGLKNLSIADIRLERGARIAHIRFERVEGKAMPYKGQWAGGRVSQPEVEVQV